MRRSSVVAAPGRLARSCSVATLLALVALLVTLGSLTATGVVGMASGSDLAEAINEDRVVAVGASRTSQVATYLRSSANQLGALAQSPATAEAIGALGEAYRILDAAPLDEDAEARLAAYYRTSVTPKLEAVRGTPVSATQLVPDGAAAVALQAVYVIADEDGPGDRSDVDDAGDGSEWSKIHATVHPAYREIAARAGFDDLYFVDVERDVVVYSVGKGIDFATSLTVGPHSGTTLAQLVQRVRAEPDGAVWADFATYGGAADRPVAFVASAVRNGDGVVGVVVARLGTDRLNGIMTNDSTWTNLGETGETYVAAADATLRSDMRGFVEDPGAYLASLEDAGLVEEGSKVEALGTTVLAQLADRRVVDAALEQGDGIGETRNRFGTDVLTAFRPLDPDGEFAGLDWVVLTEVARHELDEPIADYVRNVIVTATLIVVVWTFVAVWWSKRSLASLRYISTRLRLARLGRAGELDPGDANPLRHSPDEFVRLAADIDLMGQRLAERQDDLERRSAERLELLRQFLPRAVARRAEAGERDVLDEIPDASVVVLVLRGLGDLLQQAADDRTRALLEDLVADIDALAEQHGVDRLKLTGGIYYGGCGTSRPLLDHAPRCVAFALGAQEIVADLLDQEDGLSLGAGVATGPVMIGLTGGTRLVYDAWGTTVTTAARLAQLATSGEVIVADSTRTRLPPSIPAEPTTDTLPGESASVVRNREVEA